MESPKLVSIHDESVQWRTALEADEARLERAIRKHNGPKVFVCDRSPAPGYPISSRGVYVARFLSPRGRYVLNCIDRLGRQVAQVVVMDPAKWDDFRRAAEATLDELDPGLRLI